MYVAVAEWWVTIVEITHNYYRMWYVTFRELNRAVLRVKIPLDAVFKALFTLFTDLKRYDISAGPRAIIYLSVTVEKRLPRNKLLKILGASNSRKRSIRIAAKKTGASAHVTEKRMVLHVLFMNSNR